MEAPKVSAVQIDVEGEIAGFFLDEQFFENTPRPPPAACTGSAAALRVPPLKHGAYIQMSQPLTLSGF